jgi:hypothetical protein
MFGLPGRVLSYGEDIETNTFENLKSLFDYSSWIVHMALYYMFSHTSEYAGVASTPVIFE